MLPALQDVYMTVSGLDIPGYAVLQHGSTLVGFPVALLLFSAWYRKVAVGPLPVPAMSRGARSLWIASGDDTVTPCSCSVPEKNRPPSRLHSGTPL